MSALKQEKSAARKAAFARRAKAQASEPERAACAHLLEFLKPHRARPLAAYMAIGTEIDPITVMTAMARFGPVCVPVMQGADKALEFHRWSPGCRMISGPFGVNIPHARIPLTPEVLIVPLLAFDGRGRRLGYGGGYYDRSLQKLRAAAPVVAVGFAYGAQQVGELAVEAFDQPLDAVVTETGMVRFGG